MHLRVQKMRKKNISHQVGSLLFSLKNYGAIGNSVFVPFRRKIAHLFNIRQKTYLVAMEIKQITNNIKRCMLNIFV